MHDLFVKCRAAAIRFFLRYVEFVRFLLVGVFTLLVNLAIFYLSIEIFDIDLTESVGIAYWITVLLHFMLNRQFTFRAENQSIVANIIRYSIMLLFNFLLTLVGLWITIQVLHLSPYFNVFFSTTTSAVSSYVLMKYFVFRIR